MKKILAILVIFILFLIIYFMQANLFTWFNISGVMPNLFVILVLFIGLFAGRNVGVACGAIIGFLLDFYIGKVIGISAILYAIIALVAHVLDSNFSKDSRITIMLMVTGITFLFELILYLANVLVQGIPIEIVSFMKILLIELFFNVILTIIMYPLLQSIGHYLENTFKLEMNLMKYY